MQSRIHFCCQKQSSEDMLGEFTDSVDTSAVRDLREAAALSPELASVLQSYASATTKAEQTALLGELLNQWGATGNFNTSVERAQEQGFALRYFNSQGQDVMAWVELLETFNGATFVQVGGGGVRTGAVELRRCYGGNRKCQIYTRSWCRLWQFSRIRQPMM